MAVKTSLRPTIIDGVQEEADRQGYDAVISVIGHQALSPRRSLNILLELRVDGLILAAPMRDISTMCAGVAEVPLVLVARRSRLTTIDSVANDDLNGARLVIDHLVALGHRKIAHIDGHAAIGALSAIAGRGLRVPQDASVVRYDNTAFAAVPQINLTTVDQPRLAMGRTAVSLLLERVGRERATARHVLIPPTLVVRGTTAAGNA